MMASNSMWLGFIFSNAINAKWLPNTMKYTFLFPNSTISDYVTSIILAIYLE